MVSESGLKYRTRKTGSKDLLQKITIIFPVATLRQVSETTQAALGKMSADDLDSEEVSTMVTMDDPSSSGKENQVKVKKEGKPNKNQKKKLRKKLKNQAKKSSDPDDPVLVTDDKKVVSDTEELNVEVEYVADDVTITEELESNPAYQTFVKVFEKFRTGDKSRNDEDWSNQVPSDGDYHKKLLERKKPAELETEG